MLNKLVDPVLDNVSRVLTTMARLELHAGEPLMNGNGRVSGDISGIMSLVIADHHISVAIIFPESVILEITQRMLPSVSGAIDDKVIDLVGELTNMVVGGVKSYFQKEGYIVDMSFPSVVIGPGHVVSHKTDGPKVVIPFDTGKGRFHAEICCAERRILEQSKVASD